MPDSDVMLSIVVPVYNSVKYIEETIISILNIANKINLEVIFQNSCSTDGTTEIINKYIEKYNFMKHYNEKDRGQSNAINQGVKRAIGKWVTWLCADDLILDDFVAMIQEAEQVEAALVYGDCVLWLQNGSITPATGTESYRPGLLAKKRLVIQQPGTCILRKKWFDLDGVNEKLNWVMDYDLFLRLESAKVKFYRAKRFVSLARIHHEAKTSSGSVHRLIEYFNIIGRAHLRSISYIRLTPYVVYAFEFIIKFLESKGYAGTIMVKLFHKVFWKVAQANEQDDITCRFQGGFSVIKYQISDIKGKTCYE